MILSIAVEFSHSFRANRCLHPLTEFHFILFCISFSSSSFCCSDWLDNDFLFSARIFFSSAHRFEGIGIVNVQRALSPLLPPHTPRTRIDCWCGFCYTRPIALTAAQPDAEGMSDWMPLYANILNVFRLQYGQKKIIYGEIPIWISTWCRQKIIIIIQTQHSLQ